MTTDVGDDEPIEREPSLCIFSAGNKRAISVLVFEDDRYLSRGFGGESSGERDTGVVSRLEIQVFFFRACTLDDVFDFEALLRLC